MHNQKLSFFTHFLAIGAILAVLTILSTQTALAQVYISEYMAAPTSGNEWIELRNLANEDVSLIGWKVQDSAAFLKTIPDFDFAESVIPANGYFVFELKNKLNNNGDNLTIKDSTGWVMDYIQYTVASPTLSWSFNVETHEWALATPTRGADNDFSVLPPSPEPSASPSVSPSPSATPTPKPQPSSSSTPSPIPQPTPFASPTPSLQPSPTPGQSSQPLQLSEVVACPASGEPEWVEIYNPNSYQITLTSWKFKDRTGNTKTFSADLPSHGYQIIEITSSLLNNDGDSLAILDQSGNQVTQIDLPVCAAGQSTVYTQSGWQQTSTPTPFASNNYASASTASPSPTPYAVGYQLTGTTGSSPGSTTDANALLLSTTEDLEGLSSDETELSKVLGITDDMTLEENVPKLPQLLPLQSPIVSTDNHSTEETLQQPITQPRRIVSKFALGALFLFSMSCLSLSGYMFYQWYTEQRAQVLLEDL